jgi:hypothetical protein
VRRPKIAPRRTTSVAQLLAALVLLAVKWGPATAAVWHVEWSPFQQVGEIEAAVREAGDGDTILVGPGTYYEHIPIGGKALAILSTAGPLATTLDGSKAIPGHKGSILYSDSTSAPSLLIDGFTFTRGSGARYRPVGLVGGAVAFWATPRMGTVTIANCTFQDNTMTWDGSFAPSGGAVFLEGIATALLSNCSFLRNITASGSGDHIAVDATNLTLQSCTIALGPVAGSIGTGVYTGSSGDIAIMDCLFSSEAGSSDPLAQCLHTLSDKVAIQGTRFLDNGGCLARRVTIDAISEEPHTVVVNGNVFGGRDTCPAGEGVLIVAMRGNVEVTGNTFVGMSVGCGPLEASPILWQNNIMFRSPTVLTAASGRVACNDAWPESIRVRCCNVEMSDNVSGDPLFCDEGAMNWEIAKESVCAEENSPSGCGRIGALIVSCQRTPVKATSWGGVRALFH